MPYLFTCPHCQAQTRVEDQYSGQSGECFSCGSTLQLPEFAGTPDAIPPAKRRPIGVIVAAGVVLTLLTCLVFAVIQFGGSSVSKLAEARLKKSSIQNLETIAAALNAYALDHGTYPPATMRDSTGRAMHSWRGLILPYLGRQDIYDEFDVSKPWDNEVNLTAASYSMPIEYRHPSNRSGAQDEPGYFLITGPGTLFPPTGPLSPNDIGDDASQTILVIEGAPPAQGALGNWAQPRDLDFTRMRGVITGTVGVEPGGQLDSGAAMATDDARGHILSND